LAKPGKCSKCDQPSVGNGYCRVHNAEWQRTYQRDKLKRAEDMGFSRGVEAMRGHLAEQFARFGATQIFAFEVAEAIRRAPRPAMPDRQLNGS
jgi:hypothetical protein